MSSNQTILDRTIVAILPDPDNTPSRRDGLSASQERTQRVHGASLILSACQILQLPASCYGTACILFHRYFHAHSFQKIDAWSIAMGSTLISAKTQEIVLTVKQVILAFAHLFRKRRMIYTKNETMVKETLQHGRLRRQANVAPEATWTFDQKEAFLQKIQPISPLGPVWKEWYEALTKAENDILRSLGFAIHWISARGHPHKYLSYFHQLLLEKQPNPGSPGESIIQQIQQKAWNLCNDSFLLDFCVRYDPSVVTCAAIYLATLQVFCGDGSQDGSSQNAFVLDWLKVENWADQICGTGSLSKVTSVAKALMGLQLSSDMSSNVDLQLAICGFVPPLMEESFNGPLSFLWDMANDLAHRATSQES